MEELMKVFDIPGVDSSDEKLRQLSGYMEGILDFPFLAFSSRK